MDLQLKGRTLVTGASRIGRAIAKQLAREGVRLAVTARRKPELESLAGEIEREGAVRPELVIHDAMAEGLR